MHCSTEGNPGAAQWRSGLPPAERTLSAGEWSALARKELNSVPGVRAVVQDPSQQGFSGSRGFQAYGLCSLPPLALRCHWLSG